VSKTRNLSDLLDANGDVKSTALDNATLTGIDDNADATAITIDSSERVGINNTSPVSPLTVGGIQETGTDRASIAVKTISNSLSIGESAIQIEEQSGTEGYFMGVDSTGGLFFSNSGSATKTLYLGDDDNVGIGESSPSAQLHVNDDTHDGITAKFVNSNAGNSGADISLIKDSSSPASGDNVGTIRFKANDDGGTERTFASIQAVTEDASAGSSDVSLRFSVRGNGSTSELIRLTSSGLHIGGTGSANALDDYEEGTWTPVFQYTTTTPSFSYVNRYGRYTKIGRMVMINFSMNITSIDTGSANGDIQISGLPFTSKNPAASGGGVMVYGADVYANTYDVSVNINDNATLFTFIQSRDNEGWINLSSANDAGQLLFQGSIVYDTDS